MESDVKISTAQCAGENIEDLVIVADRRAIMQILLNLLSNAIKFSHQNSQIEVQCHRREDYVALKVIDKGVGIPANKLAQVTRPFEQVSTSYSRDHQGSGLGLAICKELAELMGGALAIESKLDEGTTVTIRIPYDVFKATNKK